MDGGVALWRSNSNSAGGVKIHDGAAGAVVHVRSALIASRVVEHGLRRKAGIVFLDVRGLVVGHGRKTVGTFAGHEDAAGEKENDDGKDNEKKT